MRFSIRLGGFCKLDANVAGTPVTVRRKLTLSLFPGGEWRWTWIDGVPMSLKQRPISCRQTNCRLLADGEMVCRSVLALPFFGGPPKEWIWTYGERKLSHKHVSRRVNTCPGMFGIPRYVLKTDGERTVGAWDAGCNYVVHGIIRPSLDSRFSGVVFGIILSKYVSEPSGVDGD